ncbi:phospholipase A2, minor isoenzyme-like [Mauremys mutica]|uniref:phospholipase A2, minor isoenzyme-like n=1 Tax=Mauremys mutica TaxID=74926 RepID=UPI001D1682F1|nr:phospholipase A2, minor isoenzyme-like [Mauremys mutica]
MPTDPMKFAMWLMLVTLLSQSAHEAQCSRRGRRSLLELGLTLWCYRQRLRTPLFALNLYGCYCGTGGSGTPLDAVDQCCFLHDCCYRHARVSLECRGRVKWQPYEFACSQSGTECRSQSVCGRMACECDRQFAECLTAAKPRKRHFFYNRRELCAGPKGSCPATFPNKAEILHWRRTPSPPPPGTGSQSKGSALGARDGNPSL